MTFPGGHLGPGADRAAGDAPPMPIDFGTAFEALTGHAPFRWQERLYRDLLAGKRYEACDIPTGLGKTAVMVIWYLALKAGAQLPRRLVYVVDRRAVVDQATTVAEEINKKSGNEDLAISTLRGQYTDNREWLADPTTPAIVVGTVDMIGSRLLFSGYGVSSKMRPYHAGFLGADTLVVLDEAHLVPPFEALLRAISRDSGNVFGPRSPEDRAIVPRFHLMSLSATGRDDKEADAEAIFRLSPDDYEDTVVQQRLGAIKRLSLRELNDAKALVPTLADHAWDLGANPKAARVLIYCNSRDDAVKVKADLDGRLKKNGDKDGKSSELLVGARRVHEREKLFGWLQDHGFISKPEDEPEREPDDKSAPPAFLVATSAGEVGVDLDADHVVCDLVEWERMVQRFGRVNRLGRKESRVEVIAAPPKKDAEKWKDRLARLRAPLDALQGDASPSAIVALKKNDSLKDILQNAQTPAPLRPALTRALVDAWSMTSLDEHTGRPDIQPWLRGWEEDDEPQTTVVWRRWLPWREGAGQPIPKDVEDFFGGAPVHLDETLEAPTYQVFEWLIDRAHVVFEAAKAAEKKKERSALNENSPAVIVLDRKGKMETGLKLRDVVQLGKLTSYDKKKAFANISGRTLVVSALIGGLNNDGMLNEKWSEIPKVLDEGWSDDILLQRIGYRVAGPGDAEPDHEQWKIETTILLAPPEVNENGEAKVLRVFVRRAPAAAREGDLAVARRKQELKEHLDWVGEAADEIAAVLKLPERYYQVLVFAARHHDHGKSRSLWQDAMGAPRDGRPYAKTTARGDGRRLNGYRHEFGSLRDVETNGALAHLDEDMRDLALHLIAAHHGYARPIITPLDPAATSLTERAERARQAASRFARVQQRWGPWGLAWWEALLRAADWYASKRHDLRNDERKEEAA